MTDLNKIINEQRERIAELEQCLVEVTSGATGQAPCAKYCEAKATEIEMRKLRYENERLSKLYKAADEGHAKLEASWFDMRNRAEAAERERDGVKRIAVDAATESFLIAAENEIKRASMLDNQSVGAFQDFKMKLERVARSCAIDCVNNQLRQQINGGE